jgi:hypothetical protein
MNRARVAIRRVLGTEVQMIHGRYGEFKVLVDVDAVIDVGLLSAVGILPSSKRTVEAVRSHMMTSVSPRGSSHD